MSRRPRLTARGQVFLGLGAVVVVIGMLLGYPDITRAGVLLASLPVLALAASLRPAPPVTVQRQVHPALVAPEREAQVHLTLRGGGTRLGALQVAEEDVDPLLGPCPRFLVPRMDPGEHHEVRYRVSSDFRGGHTLGPLRLERRDPFGLVTSRVALPGRAELVVLPRIEELDPSRLHGGGLGREGQVPHMVALHGDDDASIRAYRDGDDLRRVHWPTTAHRGELMVRQEDRPARRRAVLLLDTRADAYRQAPEAFEWAVSALSSVAVHLAAEGYAVHVVGAGAPATTDLRAVLRALALVEPGTASLASLVRDTHALTTDGAVVVTAVADHDPESALTVPAVRNPGSLGVAFVMSTASFAAGTSGAVADLVPVFSAAGWRALAVQDGDGVRDCWSAVTRGATGLRTSAAALGRSS